jgi:hypothetical protein
LVDRFLLILLALACPTTAFAVKSITVESSFSYYKDRSEESIVEELKANEYRDVRLLSGTPKLVKAFKDASVRVWYLTFMNGTYSTNGFPEGWEKWQMKLRKPGNPDGFTYLCCNNPEYREWKRKQIVDMLNSDGYDGVDLVDPYFPAYPGPSSGQYGCLCDHCIAAFKKMYPDETDVPDLSDPKSPHYWKTDKTLYEKWVGFRAASVVSFLDDIVNGKDGIREKCPKVKVATWSLGLDVADQITKLREAEGLDAAAIVKRVKPDMHVIQTHWPDWTKPSLSSKYPIKYKPVIDSIREVSPRLPLMLQTDIGSLMDMRRSRSWLEEVEKSAKAAGFEEVTSYEYSIGRYMYTEPPKIVKIEEEPDGLKLVFHKRLNAATASNIGNYTVSSGKVDYVRVDGNIVRLSISGADRDIEVTMSGISDDESRRLYHDKPACVIEDNSHVSLSDTPDSEEDEETADDF